LEDVEVLTGLPTTGSPLIVPPDERLVTDICEQWLGVAPPPSAIRGRTVRVSWVKRLFDRLSDGATAEVVTYHARAYTWVLVACVLLADRNKDHIQVHLLQLIGDPMVASTYSWGSAVLAWLYKVMGRAAFFSAGSMRGTSDIGGFTLLVEHGPWRDSPVLQSGTYRVVPAGHVEELLAADFRSSVTDWRAKYQ
ncbi:Protein MAIN-LIKE 2, partial [Linum perenne]